jgi:hypothetical protein
MIERGKGVLWYLTMWPLMLLALIGGLCFFLLVAAGSFVAVWFIAGFILDTFQRVFR